MGDIALARKGHMIMALPVFSVAINVQHAQEIRFVPNAIRHTLLTMVIACVHQELTTIVLLAYLAAAIAQTVQIPLIVLNVIQHIFSQMVIVLA